MQIQGFFFSYPLTRYCVFSIFSVKLNRNSRKHALTRTIADLYDFQRGKPRLQAFQYGKTLTPFEQRLRTISVAIDGTGPLADAELRFEWICPFKAEEGWNHEQSFVPFGMGLFCMDKWKCPVSSDPKSWALETRYGVAYDWGTWPLQLDSGKSNTTYKKERVQCQR